MDGDLGGEPELTVGVWPRVRGSGSSRCSIFSSRPNAQWHYAKLTAQGHVPSTPRPPLPLTPGARYGAVGCNGGSAAQLASIELTTAVATRRWRHMQF